MVTKLLTHAGSQKIDFDVL